MEVPEDRKKYIPIRTAELHAYGHRPARDEAGEVVIEANEEQRDQWLITCEACGYVGRFSFISCGRDLVFPVCKGDQS